jgi:hypothetical protein
MDQGLSATGWTIGNDVIADSLNAPARSSFIFPSPNKIAGANWKCRSAIFLFYPKGISAISPGLRGASYPGNRFQEFSQTLKGLNQIDRRSRLFRSTFSLGKRKRWPPG